MVITGANAIEICFSRHSDDVYEEWVAKASKDVKEVTLFWHYVTLNTGKSALVDFSKVMYITGNAEDGSTLHFQLESENSSGKTAPKSITIKESVLVLGKILKSRKLF